MTVLINPYRFGVVAPYADAYLGELIINTTPTSSTYTFSNVSIGTADSRRQIILAFGTNAGTATLHSSVTANAGAITFSKLVQSLATANSNMLSLWQANVPTGTTLTAPILTVSASSARGTMHAWAHGRGAMTNTASNNAGSTGTMDVPANGLAIAHSSGTQSTASDCTWTAGITTEDYDALQGATYYNSGGRYVNDAVADTSKTFTGNWTAGMSNTRLVVASWGAQV